MHLNQSVIHEIDAIVLCFIKLISSVGLRSTANKHSTHPAINQVDVY